MTNTVHYEQALAHEQRGEFGQALALYQACLASETDDPGDLLFRCGWCLEHAHRSDNPTAMEALAYYMQAAEASRTPATTLNSLFRAGWVLMQEHRWLEAAQFLRKAIDKAALLALHDALYAHTVYWYAVCLETQGRLLEAIDWYRLTQTLTPVLQPESAFREMLCLEQIGSYHDALHVCSAFPAHPPTDFDADRYAELFSLVRRKKAILEACLNQAFYPAHKKRISNI
jgi:tetratricopeptide (TPR) repeat protein